MSDLDALLAGIVADPHNAVRWLVMADWLEDHGQPERAELVRVHRELLRTCTDPDAFPERPQLHARMMELMRAGVQPCIPQKTLTLPGGVELKMSFIPSGSFLMGSPESEKEWEIEEREDGRTRYERLHEVRLTKGFWQGVHPVTQAQWVAVMGKNLSHFKGETRPKDRASWKDAQAFCAAVERAVGVKLRLPTEAEWEYAARAGTTTPFYWGTELNGTQANCDGSEHPYGMAETDVGPSFQATTPVGSYAEVSPHPWELTDVIGNVYEWCADLYDEEYYANSPTDDPAGPERGTYRVVRGECYAGDPPHCRVAARGGSAPNDRNACHGFRIAADSTGLV